MLLGLSAIAAVLLSDTRTYAVGGVSTENFAEWFAAGVTAFDIGSGMYKPGDSADTVARNALDYVNAFDSIFTPS